MQGDGEREFAGYRIESEIGRGGMGVVYLATQAFPERRVALKVLSPELADDPAFRERFVRESNAAASTEHPNIVPVYAAGESDGRLYLAMRYIEGTDLRSLLERDGPLDPERAARICAQVAEALEAAHERGLVHRDVKPANVLLDGRERAYLSDFGLIRRTRVETGITKTGQFMGTVDYAAPEQIKGEDLDGRVDVYSLGCILYECLVGRPPFRRDSEVATMYAQLEESVPAPSSSRPGVPQPMDAIVSRATAKSPGDRFATAAEMAEALRGGAPRADDGSQRRVRRRVVIGAAVVLVVIATVAGVLALRDDGSPTPSEPTATTSGSAIPLNSLAQVDAETGEIVAVAEERFVGGGIGDIGRVDVGEGGVWIMATDNVVHVDPETASFIGSISVNFARSIAVGYRTVWVGAVPGVVRIDPIDDRHLRPVGLFGSGVVGGSQVAVGAGSAWAVTGDGELTRIDPETGDKIGSVDTGQTATGLGVDRDGVWVIDDLQGTLVRVDPVTLNADEPVEILGDLDEIAVGSGAVWLLDQSQGIVNRYDPDSGRVTPIRVGLEPTDLTTGLDAVWVANNGDGTISRIDPDLDSTESIAIGAPVASLAVDPSSGTLWITVARIQGGFG